MTFVWPWTFLALVPVVAAALLALLRPRRHLVVVASLSLWEEAISSSASTSRRKTRRTSLAWLLLLIGAIAAVGSASRPIYHSSGPVRKVTLVLHPSAELGRDGTVQMRLAGERLLGRLDSGDRLQLLLPEILGGETGWVSLAEARRVLVGLSHLPVPAAELRGGHPSAEASHVYHLAVSSLDISTGPAVSRIDIPTHLPTVTIDAVGAERTAGGKLQVFAALRNQGGQSASARLTVSNALGGGGNAGELNVTIPPKSRRSLIVTVPPAEALSVTVHRGDSPVAVAYLVRVKTPARSVAVIGRDDPYLRRMIKVDPTLRLVADRAVAEIVIANEVSPPPGKAALVIAPPAPPPPWRLADGEITSVMLAGANVTGDDPIMRGVDLSAAAIRSVRPWVRGDVPGAGVLVGYKGSVLVVRTADDAGAEAPRRVYVAFDLSENNCTLVRTDAYVVFLANVMRYLVPGAPAGERYEYSTVLQAGANPAWKPIVRDETFASTALETAGLTAPGIFRDAGGQLHAVSLVALRSAPVSIPFDRAVAAAPLPDAQPLTQGRELWSILLASAGALWLAAWSLAALRG
ncbi:MAG: BatA domain-containing protein [Phycisphaerae bacterium]|nr:BatA domain-containing protein [Phycisphaerae bacterium]